MQVKPLKYMPGLRVFITICALALTALPQSPPAQIDERGGIDWIFMLDTSASMRGVGGTRDIFAKVKSALKDFILRTREGDSVTIYTFDSNPELLKNTRISGNIDKSELVEAIDRIPSPQGQWTHTGKALRKALERTNELKSRSDASNRTVSIVLLTDGKEDVDGIPPQERVPIPSNLSLISKDQPYIFVVSLGSQHDEGLEQFVTNPKLGGRGKIIKDTGAGSLDQINDDIRKVVQKPVAPPPKPRIRQLALSVSPDSIDFGEVDRGTTTSSQTITCSSGADTRVRVSLDSPADSGISLIEPKDDVDIKQDASAVIHVRLQAAPGAADGIRNVRLALTPESAPPDVNLAATSLNATLRVTHVPIWRSILKWILLALALALIGIVLLSLYKGQMPNEVWRKFNERKFLEGELEILRPRPSHSEDGLIALKLLKSERIRLGSLLPEGVTNDSEAEIITVRKNANKRVQLRWIQGKVSVNKVEVATTDLYNGDVIDIGDARLQFNSTYERPLSSSDEIL